MMKPFERTSSSPASSNGGNGRAFPRNGNCVNSPDARATPSQKSARHVNENGPASSADRFTAGLGEVRQRFVPIAAGRSETASALPGPSASDTEILLLYCLNGRGWCEIGAARNEITPGHLFVIPAKAQRTCGSHGENPWSLIWVQLALMGEDPFASDLSATPRSLTLGAPQKTEMLALFQETFRALEMPSPQRVMQVSQRVMHLLDASIPSQAENCQAERDSAVKIARSIEYMKQHLDKPLRAATLAAVANMSLPHYFAQFKLLIGGSPIDYLIKLRMEHARRLLSETSWSVKEVAVSLGYDDPLYFSRVFKSINRMPPSDFRARKRSPVGG